VTEPEDRESKPAAPKPPDSSGAWLPPRLREKIEEAEAGGGGESKTANLVGLIVTVLVIVAVAVGVWSLIRSGHEKEKARLAAVAAAAAAERAAFVADSLATVHRADSLAAVARADSIAFAKLPKWQQQKVLAEKAKKAAAATAASASAATKPAAGAATSGTAATKPAPAAGAAARHASKTADSSAAEPAAPKEMGPFGVDAGQFIDQAQATQIADDLKTKAGLPTQVVTVGEGDAATYHVFVGKFSTHAAAEAAATRLRAKGLVQQGAVTPLPKTP